MKKSLELRGACIRLMRGTPNSVSPARVSYCLLHVTDLACLLKKFCFYGKHSRLISASSNEVSVAVLSILSSEVDLYGTGGSVVSTISFL